MLCHFGRTRNGYLGIRFIVFSSTAESSATSCYVVVPERSGKSEARASRNVDWTKKKPTFVPSRAFKWCNWKKHVHMNFNNHLDVLYFKYSFIFGAFSQISSYGKTCWLFVFIFIYCVVAGITILCPFLTDWTPTISVERWKRRGPWGKKWTKSCISHQSRHFFFIDVMIKVRLPICTLNWLVSNFVFRQGKGINRRNESTIINI